MTVKQLQEELSKAKPETLIWFRDKNGYFTMHIDVLVTNDSVFIIEKKIK